MMKKVRWCLLVITMTCLTTILLTNNQREKPVEARIVHVQRADVHQIVAVTGKLAYENEEVLYALSSGKIAQVCVEAGQRIGAGEALIRMEASIPNEVISAYVSAVDEFAALQQLSPNNNVIRAEEACTVRDVFVGESAMVTTGMPLVRLTSNQQKVVCNVVPVDTAKMKIGMWAWIVSEGETIGHAVIESIGKKKADPISGFNYQEIILIPEQHIELPESTTLDIDVFINGSDDVTAIPLEALTERGTVWWVDHGRCTEIPAEIVMTDEMLAWVNLPEGIAVAVGEFMEGQRVVEAQE